MKATAGRCYAVMLKKEFIFEVVEKCFFLKEYRL